MSRTGLRRHRDKLLFALAYSAVVAAVLFLHPLSERREPVALAIAGETAR